MKRKELGEIMHAFGIEQPGSRRNRKTISPKKMADLPIKNNTSSTSTFNNNKISQISVVNQSELSKNP